MHCSRNKHSHIHRCFQRIRKCDMQHACAWTRQLGCMCAGQGTGGMHLHAARGTGEHVLVGIGLPPPRGHRAPGRGQLGGRSLSAICRYGPATPNAIINHMRARGCSTAACHACTGGDAAPSHAAQTQGCSHVVIHCWPAAALMQPSHEDRALHMQKPVACMHGHAWG